MNDSADRARPWVRIALDLRAIVFGLLIGMVAANLWPVLLLKVGMPAAAALELALLAVYVFWSAGGGPPRALRVARAERFRLRSLSARDWLWGSIAAVSFAATIHAAIVLLFRFVPYPAAAFHRGYDFSFIPSHSMQWLACVVSAISAAICEETGFRGYMQQPIERNHGPAVAILTSSLFFTLIHFTKDWALIGMVPIVFGAGLLLGWMARAAGTLVFGMIGHTIMDVGLFAYWWTQIAGVFAQKPIPQAGMDTSFVLECAVFALMLSLVVVSIGRLRGGLRAA
jgi:membrane protease YdiL (CAAX protease family)